MEKSLEHLMIELIAVHIEVLADQFPRDRNTL